MAATMRRISIAGPSICKLALVLTLVLQVKGYDNWEDYWEAWQKNPYYPRMYPFGRDFHDETFTQTTDGEIEFTLPYYGRHYDTLAISLDGHLELSHHGQPMYTTKAPMMKWPNPQYPYEKDPPFISPFLSSFSVFTQGQTGYYRRLDPREMDTVGRALVDVGVLELLSDHVQRNVVGGERFSAEYGVVVTWYNLPFYGCTIVPEANCPPNTFQAAVVTDEIDTYVIYNYYNITWAGSTRQQCDGDTGTATSNRPNCFQAQVGFNAGRAEDFRPLPYSNTDGVVELDEFDGGTGVLGRFLYRVGLPIPLRGGCSLIEEDIGSDDWPIEVYPRYGSMLGGERIYVSGPCFQEDMPITCKFGTIEVKGFNVNGTKSKAMCVNPPQWTIGKIKFSVSIDGGVNWSPSTSFLIVPPFKEPRVQIENDGGEWFIKDPKQVLYYNWDPEHLADHHDPADDGSSHMVHISLMLYTEHWEEEGRMFGGEASRAARMSQIELQEAHVFDESVINSGTRSFVPAEERCQVDCGWEKPPVGMLRICREDTMADIEPYCIWSEPLPVGWYIHGHMSEMHGEDWPYDFCIEWRKQEMDQGIEWADELIPCPLTLHHASNDIGQYKIDRECDLEVPAAKCPKDPEQHIYCVDDILPPSTNNPSSSRCCYNDHGNLIFSGDNIHAGGSSRASPYGTLPYGEATKVPLLSHWYHDVVPYYMCCNWTNDGEVCIEQYMSVRPTADLLEYHPPKHAIAFGDPHFQTFDGVRYTFNGRGEYWLLWTDPDAEGLDQYDHMNVQARMQSPNVDMWGPDAINATVLTAVAMQEGTSPDQNIPRVQIQLSDDMDLPVHLMVYVDGQLQDFTKPDFMEQEFTNMDLTRQIRIINNDPPEQNEQSNITVMFQSGLAVNVANKEGLMHVMLAVPELYYGHTRGLLGSWNDDPEDDITRPDGSPIDPETEVEDLHALFGEKQVVPGDPYVSRFNYYAAMDWSYFRDENFKPNFVEPEHPIWPPPGCNITDEDVDHTCGDDFECRFDMKMTLRADVGVTTMEMEQWIEFVANVTKPIPACGYLDVPHSVREVDSYLQGGHVKFSGCAETYRFQGKDEYHCEGEDQPEWRPTPDAYCKSQQEIDDERTKKAIAIAVPLCLLFVIALLGVTGFFLYRRKKQEGGTGTGGEGKTGTEGGGKAMDNKAYTGYTGSMPSVSPAHSRTSMDTFGSNVLTQDLQPMRPPRPASQFHPTPNDPHYTNQAMIQDMEQRQQQGTTGGPGGPGGPGTGGPWGPGGGKRNSNASSDVSLTGIGAGVSLDPQGLSRYSNVPPPTTAPTADRSFDRPSPSLDQSVERPPSRHGSQASLSAAPNMAPRVNMYPNGAPPPPPTNPPPYGPGRSSVPPSPAQEPRAQTPRVPPSPAASSGRLSSGPSNNPPLQSYPSANLATPEDDDDDLDAEYRMSVASRGTPRGSQMSLRSNQQVVFTPGGMGVDTMV